MLKHYGISKKNISENIEDEHGYAKDLPIEHKQKMNHFFEVK